MDNIDPGQPFHSLSQITFIFIVILFVDSVNRVYRVQVELSSFGKSAKQGGYVLHSPCTTSGPTADICLF